MGLYGILASAQPICVITHGARMQGDVPAILEGDVTIDFSTAADDVSRRGPPLQAATEPADPSVTDRLGAPVEETLGGGVGGPSGRRAQNEPENPAKTAFWQLSHYSRFFNVDTQVCISWRHVAA
jgi:hypothetical protein